MTITSTAFFLGLAIQVLAQSTEVTQCISEYQWSINSLNQNPCMVAAYLETQCTPQQPYDVPILPAGNHYTAPNFTAATPCLCSSVTYQLISACAGCQGRNFLNWTSWSINCPVVKFLTYPMAIPPATEVATWAYLNVTQTNDTFDPTVARNNVGKPSTIPSNAPTTSSSNSLVASNPTASIASDGTDSTASKHSNAGAIAGGVVGGLAFLAIVGLLAFWLILRKRNSRNNRAIKLDLDESNPTTPEPMREQFTGHRDGPSPMNTIPTQYFDSETTFPMSPTSSAFYTTVPARRSMETVSQYGSQAQAPRGYTGAAEI
ncbi:hypothetical protein BDQ12DRAFT_274686 [Crucibulum laeve]|uniref:receptor protein-tyrosine kinase n=1 Tax=Crucibulum laeve TaxID=68775 RepID=A0A5C3MC04_9AGAR|nr:hypothetical protein BDQ12DRAFT_274686 [Crucibulum laeve]